MTAFINCFKSEWLKKKHTASTWIIWICAFFMPLLIMVVRLLAPSTAYRENNLNRFWDMIHFRNWAPMGMFLLPLVLILSASLVTNLEYKNNTWKQLHNTPQTFTTIFFAKFSVILVMVLQMFVIFHICIYVSALAPGLVFSAVPQPTQQFPLIKYLRSGFLFFIDCLPILALQYLLGLHFKNFLVAIGVGFSLLVVSLLSLAWKYGYIVPYIYLPLSFKENQTFVDQHINRHYCAVIYFAIITALNYLFYIRKKDKS